MPTRKRRNRLDEQFPEILRLLGIIQTRRKQNETTSTDLVTRALNVAIEAVEHLERVTEVLERAINLWGEREDQWAAKVKHDRKADRANYQTYRRMLTREAQIWLDRHKALKEANKARKDTAQAKHEQIRQHARKLLRSGNDFHELSGILAPAYKLTPQQIRAIIKPLRPERKKAKAS